MTRMVSGLLAASIALSACAAARVHGSSTGAKPRTIAVVKGQIGALAQSRHRLAWLCPKAEVFDLRTHRGVRISPRSNFCYGPGGLAFDGNRVLWEQGWGAGNTEAGATFYTAALDDRRTHIVGYAHLSRGDRLEYDGLLPVAGGAAGLFFYRRCETCGAQPESDVWTLVGDKPRKLFDATRPVGLALVGRQLAVLEDRVGCCQYSPSWSPDGRRIAWIHDASLLAADADGTHRVALVSPEGRQSLEGPSSWSPDGTKLARSPSTNPKATARRSRSSMRTARD